MRDSIPDSFHTKNHILRRLELEELGRLRPSLEQVSFPHGHVVLAPEETITHVYFPDDAMVSVVAENEAGQTAEAGVIGHEGAVGIDIVLGGKFSLNNHIIQLPNGGWRINADAVLAEFARGGNFQELMLHFTRSLLLQISQTALCNRLHSTEKRLARWLLMCHDRAPSDRLHLTQEFISLMLGANRTTVTLTAIQLQEAGFIAYTRGNIEIIDRKGLENFCCSCYETIRKGYAAIGNPA